jgi:hypothetical protein
MERWSKIVLNTIHTFTVHREIKQYFFNFFNFNRLIFFSIEFFNCKTNSQLFCIYWLATKLKEGRPT